MLPFGSHGAKGSAGVWVMDTPQDSCPGASAIGHSSGVPSWGQAGETPPAKQAGFGTSSCCPGRAEAQILLLAMPWAGCHFGKGHFIALLLHLLAHLWLCSAYLHCQPSKDTLGISPAEAAWPGVSGWL